MAGAPLARSDITLSRSAMNRKRLWQRFGRISVSDQSHCRHGLSDAAHRVLKQALWRGERRSRGDASGALRRPAIGRSHCRQGLSATRRPAAPIDHRPPAGPASRAAEWARSAPRKRREMPRCRPAKRHTGRQNAKPQAMTRKASGTERNLTHSYSPMYSPSTWNATGRADFRVSSSWSCRLRTLRPCGGGAGDSIR